MIADLARARALLAQGEHTVVLCRGAATYTDTRRGVAPLLSLLDGGKDLSGFCAADKVVGKAAALLYCRLGVVAVYAPVMSVPARETLDRAGITALWDDSPSAIRNRAGDGLCPMEIAVWETQDPEEAEVLIRCRLAQLQAASSQ